MAHFHLAFPVVDLDSTRAFYEKLGCQFGRRTDIAMVIQLGDTQMVAHAVGGEPAKQNGIYPRHFGLIFGTRAEWEDMYARALEHDLPIADGPRIRYDGKPPEHHSFFVEDPSGNLVEFKYYKNPAAVFGLGVEPSEND